MTRPLLIPVPAGAAVPWVRGQIEDRALFLLGEWDPLPDRIDLVIWDLYGTGAVRRMCLAVAAIGRRCQIEACAFRTEHEIIHRIAWKWGPPLLAVKTGGRCRYLIAGRPCFDFCNGLAVRHLAAGCRGDTSAHT